MYGNSKRRLSYIVKFVENIFGSVLVAIRSAISGRTYIHGAILKWLQRHISGLTPVQMRMVIIFKAMKYG